MSQWLQTPTAAHLRRAWSKDSPWKVETWCGLTLGGTFTQKPKDPCLKCEDAAWKATKAER